MAIKVKTASGTGTGAANTLGTVPADKEWIITFLHVNVTTATVTNNPLELDVDGKQVASTDGTLGTDRQFNLVGPQQGYSGGAGGSGFILGPKVLFAMAGQAVAIPTTGNTIAYEWHMSYLERDVPA